MVETAITLPLFLLLVATVVDLSVAVLRYHEVSLAAQAIVRQASVHGSLAPPKKNAWGPHPYTYEFTLQNSDQPSNQNSGDENLSSPANNEQILAEVQENLWGLEKYPTELNLEWPDGDNHWGSRVRATVQTTYEPLFFFKRPIVLNATCTSTISH